MNKNAAMPREHRVLLVGPRVPHAYTAGPNPAGDRWLLTLFGHWCVEEQEVHGYTFHTRAVQSCTHPPEAKKMF